MFQKAAALVVAFALGACSGIDLGRPQAFPRDGMDSIRIAAIAETVPLAVLPPTGLAPDDAQAAAAAIAEALTTPERPAQVGRPAGPADVLTGDIQIVSERAGQSLVARWRFMPLKEAPRDVSVRIAVASGEVPGPELWRRLSAATVTALTAPVVASAPPERTTVAGAEAPAAEQPAEQPAALPLPPVTVRDADGAPGDGPAALAAAMRRELGRFGFPKGADGDGASFVIAPEVRIMPAGMTENVRIDWIVADPDGVEAGRITQENGVPSGALIPRWGEVAMLAAQAAALSVGELVAAAHEQRAADAALRGKAPADR